MLIFKFQCGSPCTREICQFKCHDLIECARGVGIAELTHSSATCPRVVALGAVCPQTPLGSFGCSWASLPPVESATSSVTSAIYCAGGAETVTITHSSSICPPAVAPAIVWPQMPVRIFQLQ